MRPTVPADLLRGAGAGIAGVQPRLDPGRLRGGGEAATGRRRGGLRPRTSSAAEPGDTLNFANWPAYIDQDQGQGRERLPSVAERPSQEETGIDVNYRDVINDNEEFFGKIQPLLAAGRRPGLGHHRHHERPVVHSRAHRDNGWVPIELDPTKRPNFDANAADWAKDPVYDPGNKYTMAWQSGITGIGVNTKLVNGPDHEDGRPRGPCQGGPDSVGMFKGDMPDWVMVNLGIDPETSGPDEWKEAAAWLQMQNDSGTVREYYGHDYLHRPGGREPRGYDGLVGRRPVLARLARATDLEFVVPEGGALIWIDNMMVPVGRAEPGRRRCR